MDPRDDLESLAGGVDCAACGDLVPADRIRLLARRDDILFVEVACPRCDSESLGIVIAEDDAADDAETEPASASRTYGEFGPRDIERFREATPIAASDVDVVRRLLTRGGLSALVGGEPPAPGSPR